MEHLLQNITLVLPEMMALGFACLAIILDLILGKRLPNTAYAIVQLGLVSILITLCMQWQHPSTTTLHELYVHDKLASINKFFIVLCSFIAFLYSRQYVQSFKLPRAEYFVLGLLAVLGMMVMSSAGSFISLYLGLEILSVPLYAMIAMQRDNSTATEASMKFFVMSAMASGMLLYGMSIIYGSTHSLTLSAIAPALSGLGNEYDLLLVFGLVFIVAGVVFKLGAVPFHMWVPDVYEGSPSAVTLFIASAPKIAGLILLMRLMITAMPSLSAQWQQIFLAASILSMALGNIAAIAQDSIKRMLAYSSIAHMGYMLLGVLAITNQGYTAALVYIIAYAFMSLGAFGIIVLLSKEGIEINKIDDLKGLNTRHPWLAFLMLVMMFSMAGIPPTIGFFAKLAVLKAIIAVNLTWLAVLALVFAIIGAYYYIRVIKVMYFEEPDIHAPIIVSAPNQIMLTLNGAAIIGLGLFPSVLVELCKQAF